MSARESPSSPLSSCPPIFIKTTIARLGNVDHSLVDTGASVTMIKASFASPLFHHLCLERNPNFLSLEGRQGDCLGTLPLSIRHGTVEIDLDRVVVVPSLSYDLIIGRDWLTKSCATIDFSSGEGCLILPKAQNLWFSLPPSTIFERSISNDSIEPLILELEKNHCAENIAITNVNKPTNCQNLDPSRARGGVSFSTAAITNTSRTMDPDLFVEEGNRTVKSFTEVGNVNVTECIIPKLLCKTPRKVSEKMFGKVIELKNGFPCRILSFYCKLVLIQGQLARPFSSIVKRPVDRLLSRFWFPGIVSLLKFGKNCLNVYPQPSAKSLKDSCELIKCGVPMSDSARMISKVTFIVPDATFIVESRQFLRLSLSIRMVLSHFKEVENIEQWPPDALVATSAKVGGENELNFPV